MADLAITRKIADTTVSLNLGVTTDLTTRTDLAATIEKVLRTAVVNLTGSMTEEKRRPVRVAGLNLDLNPNHTPRAILNLNLARNLSPTQSRTLNLNHTPNLSLSLNPNQGLIRNLNPDQTQKRNRKSEREIKKNNIININIYSYIYRICYYYNHKFYSFYISKPI